MANSAITHFDLDPERLESLYMCMENYEIGDSDLEWPNNIISRKAVVYSSGVIRHAGKPLKHNVDPDELALCKRLTEEAYTIMDGIEVGMGSESSDPFYQFFIAANRDDSIPDRITEAFIRTKFGNTIFPLAIKRVFVVKRQKDHL